MAGPFHAPTAEIRRAVRATLAELSPGERVLVALSGGADSMALAAAVAAEAPTLGVSAGAVIVDHGLQDDSAEVAASAAERAGRLGLAPVDVVAVSVSSTGAGIEAAARTARYAAFAEAAQRHRARLVLLGHTRDDQAEQVLLGLARGSGARSLAGMPSARGLFRRPLLDIDRAATRSMCEAAGLPWWQDPMNDDPAYLRVRARQALADLERDLGPGLAAALARSASQLREDADHLDSLADLAVPSSGPEGLELAALAQLPRAIRTRVWRRLLLAAGAPAGQLGSRHTDACDRLLTHWHGQGPIHLPGDLRVTRREGRIEIAGPGLR